MFESSAIPTPDGEEFVPDLATLEWLGVRVVRADDEPSRPSDSWLDRLEHPEHGPVSWLGELPPSGRLLTELENLPPDVADEDYDAVEMVSHWHRLEAYCAASKRLAAAALAKRQAMRAGLAALHHLKGGLGVVTQQPNIAADELSLRLGIGTRAARQLVESGQAFTGVAIPVAEALAAGDIDAVKADLIVDAVSDLPPETALEVQDRVLARAAHLPSGTVRRELAAACAAIDAEHYEERCRAAAVTRRVCRPRVLPRGMASLYAVMPAFEANQLFRAVDAAAGTAKASGDPRSMDQLRADALAMLGANAVQTGWIGSPTPDLSTTRGAGTEIAGSSICAETDVGPVGTHQPVTTGQSVPSQTHRGTAARRDRLATTLGPSMVPTAAPVAAATRDRAAAPQGSPMPAGFDRGAGGTRVEPGVAGLHTNLPPDAPVSTKTDTPGKPMRLGKIARHSAHVRVVVPFHSLMPVAEEPPNGTSPTGRAPDRSRRRPTEQPPAEEPPNGTSPTKTGPGRSRQTSAEEPEELPAGELPAEQRSAAAAGSQPSRSDPAFLEGYGPIPASVARALAAGSIWERMVLDPIDGRVRELSTPKYRPPAAMADLVRAENPECTQPGCSVPADSCDLDHLIPWPVGTTSVDGLGPLCRRHHLLVTHAGWQYTTAPSRRSNSTGGTQRTWTTTAGHSYSERADGSLDHKPHKEPAVRTAHPNPADPPPF